MKTNLLHAKHGRVERGVRQGDPLCLLAHHNARNSL